MRHNQNGRNMRGGRRHNGGHHGGGHSNGGSHNNSHSNNGHHRRINPRVQTFDSNGPEVRVRGNAYQITEKYLTLARDATAAGDRVLAESYFQFAEHYQRIINEANEEMARYQASLPPQQQQVNQPIDENAGDVSQQPGVPLNDLDQSFLTGGHRTSPQAAQTDNRGHEPSAEAVVTSTVRPAEAVQTETAPVARSGRAPRVRASDAT